MTCEPSQPIEGIVVDRDTKQPLSGFSVTSYGFLNDGPSRFIGQTDLKTTTDKEGRFVLHGMPKGKGNSIIVTAPTTGQFAQPYITQVADVPDAPGLDPIQMQVGVQRGVWISGKVMEAGTGTPLVDVGVQYMPCTENEAAQKLESFKQILIVDTYGTRTDKEGRYRFVGVPGPAVVAAWVLYGSKYPAGQGWEAVAEKIKSRQGRFRAPNSQSTAYKAVDVPATGNEDLTFEISTGKSIEVKTVDNDGNAVEGVSISFVPVYTQNSIRKDKSDFELAGFLPGKKKTTVFVNSEKNSARWKCSMERLTQQKFGCTLWQR